MPREINFFELPLEAYHGKLPYPLVSLIKTLTDLKANTVENIFIKTKESESAHQLISELSKGKVQNWSKYKDISSLAYVFKQYLIKLFIYEPLIPIDCFTVISSMISIDDLNKKINLCQSILSGLLVPKKARYALIDYIFSFFKFISDDSATNKMTAEQLSEIFTPIIQRHDNTSSISEEVANQCVQFIIENYQTIFTNDPSEKEFFIMTDKEIDSLRVPTVDFDLVSIAVNNYKYRKDHVIKYIPICVFSKAKRFKRPERRPPPKPVTSTQLAVNMFDSTIQRFNDDDNNKKFLINVRTSVKELNPIDDEKLSKRSPKPSNKHKTAQKVSIPAKEPSNKPPKPKQEEPPKQKKEESSVQIPSRRSKTLIPEVKQDEKPSKPSKNESNEPEKKSNVKNMAAMLANMGPMGMPMVRRKTVTPEENPSPMPMPMGGPRPTVIKDDEDSPIEKVVDQPGQMIHRTPRRGGNRRPPKILSES